jgi:RimJ/RimL family protein N-acetyltransferase
MATPPDPMTALERFQQSLDQIALTPSQSDPDLLFVLDQPGASTRLTFVRLADGVVTAFAMFFAQDPTDGVLLFHGFFAVPPAYRNQGRAKDIVKAAMQQIASGFAQAPVDAIRVGVTVDTGNLVAQRVAAAVISPKPEAIRDPASGLPALHYSATLKRKP